jgi:hypothetical protein
LTLLLWPALACTPEGRTSLDSGATKTSSTPLTGQTDPTDGGGDPTDDTEETPPEDTGETVETEPPAGTVFFATDVLHEIEVEVDEEYLDSLEYDLETRVPCTVTVDGETVTEAGCRKKGQSTLRPLWDKPSFSIQLDEFVAGQDIDGIEKFIVNNTVMDPSFLSEPLSYLLYERAGIPSPRTAHATLRFNGETKGFYVVVESVNKQFLRERFGDGEGNLYEGPWDFTQDPYAVELKDEDEGRTRDDLIALTEVVLDAPDDELEDALAPIADIDELITSVAVDMSFCLWDGYAIAAWNFYLYDDPARGFVLLPHGADWPYFVSDVDPTDVDLRPWGDQFPPGYLAVRLTAPPFDGRYLDALHAVRDEAFDEAVLLARVDEVDAVLHAADTADSTLADELYSFEGAVDGTRDFVRDRRAFLEGF